MLHHHLHFLPIDCHFESVASWLGWPHHSELPLGDDLLRQLIGKCDLVLHGHRHVPSRTSYGDRPVVLNAGSSTGLLAYRRITYDSTSLHEEWVTCSNETLLAPVEVALA
jgi:predicted phosphodiesterase